MPYCQKENHLVRFIWGFVLFYIHSTASYEKWSRKVTSSLFGIGSAWPYIFEKLCKQFCVFKKNRTPSKGRALPKGNTRNVFKCLELDEQLTPKYI